MLIGRALTNFHYYYYYNLLVSQQIYIHTRKKSAVGQHTGCYFVWLVLKNISIRIKQNKHSTEKERESVCACVCKHALRLRVRVHVRTFMCVCVSMSAYMCVCVWACLCVCVCVCQCGVFYSKTEKGAECLLLSHTDGQKYFKVHSCCWKWGLQQVQTCTPCVSTDLYLHTWRGFKAITSCCLAQRNTPLSLRQLYIYLLIKYINLYITQYLIDISMSITQKVVTSQLACKLKFTEHILTSTGQENNSSTKNR